MVDVIIAVRDMPLHLLQRCLSSLAAQTYRDFQVLLVDDGSKAVPADQYDSLVRDFPFVRVFHQDPLGVSAARNLALEHSTGEFVAFVDGDDTVAPGFLSEATGLQKESDADVVSGCFAWTYVNGEVPSAPAFPKGEHHLYGEKDRQFLCRNLLSDKVDPEHAELSGFYNGSCSAKLYRGDLARSVRFAEGVAYREDRFYNISIARRAGRYLIVNRLWYSYVQYESSAAHGVNHSLRDAFRPSMHFLGELYRWDPALLPEITWTRRDITEKLLYGDLLARDQKGAGKRVILPYLSAPDFSKLLSACSRLPDDRNGNLIDSLIRGKHWELLVLVIRCYLLLGLDRRVPAGNGYQLFSKDAPDRDHQDNGKGTNRS